MKRILVLLLTGFQLLTLGAQVSFSGPDINGAGEVLFSAQTQIPGKGSYQTLFRHNLQSKTQEQLSFYPEAMDTLSGGTILQVRNRFGTARYNTVTGTFMWMEEYRPFISGGTVSLGRVEPLSPSPDGRWVVSLEPTSAAWGRLVLHDIQRGLRYIIAEQVERGPLPVRWAPDSSVLLYALRGSVFFARPESFFSVSVVEERYRTIGSGTIDSVAWFSASHFLYVNGTAVYRIAAAELFTRSLYTDLVGIGTLSGKLPCDFDPVLDRFFPSPDGTALLYARDIRNVYYCPLTGDDYVTTNNAPVMPHLLLPGNTATVSFFWASASSAPAVFTGSVQDGKKILRAWQLTSTDNTIRIFNEFSVPANAEFFIPSPDRRMLAFNSPAEGLQVYDTTSWKEVSAFNDEPVVSAVWADEAHLFIGGGNTVRKWQVRTGASTVLFLSSVSAYGWDEQNSAVVAETGTLGRFTYEGNMKWQQTPLKRIKPAMLANTSWRLYLDSSNGYYQNMLYARSALSPGGTVPLISEPDMRLDSLDSRSPLDSGRGVFSNGSRSRSRYVSLVFNALDSQEGLAEILHLLKVYNIRATFFINGEFIRRHPSAVNEIARAGHQSASLFFTTWDLSGTAYRIDRDFIIRGLARNEDDFYAATGQELSLLWHAPNYVITPLLVEAGESAGYRYVSADVSVLDWVSAADERRMPGVYRSANALVEEIIKVKRPGSIIPIRIGKPAGERDDYLYQKIDILINALIEGGYRIVPVSTLLQEAREQ